MNKIIALPTIKYMYARFHYCFRKKALYSRGVKKLHTSQIKQKKCEPCGGGVFYLKSGREFEEENLEEQNGRAELGGVYFWSNNSLNFYLKTIKNGQQYIFGM